MENNERKAKNSEARIRANNKYTRANYKNVSIKIRPEQAEAIRETAKQFNISIAQLIINSVNEYKTNHGADTDGETAEKPQEEETENEIEREETTAREEEAEDIPEELKAVRAAWARMGAFNEKITAERKRREAEERERRREITDEERYMMR
jgi:type IV secretory pathway VirB10-like protein